MRHSCATWLYNEMGIPLEIIQDILGHSTPLITKTLYTHASVKAQDQAMKLINDRFRDAGL
jgi:integrase